MMQFEPIQIQNNFEKQKETFKKETGKKWDEDISMYITYVNMKANDFSAQINLRNLEDYRLLTGILTEKIDGLYKELTRIRG